LIIILIVFSILLFLISFILCIIARQYHKKRIIQIKPESILISIVIRIFFLFLNSDKSLAFPLSTNNQIVSNNNEIPSQSFETYSSQHEPGCPKYLPSSDYNLLTSDLFTHTTIDNIKKMYILLFLQGITSVVFFSSLEFFRIFRLINSKIKHISIFIFHQKLRIYQLKNFIDKEKCVFSFFFPFD
jgi:hypothetical protein